MVTPGALSQAFQRIVAVKISVKLLNEDHNTKTIDFLYSYVWEITPGSLAACPMWEVKGTWHTVFLRETSDNGFS